MQIKFNEMERSLLTIILNDVVAGTKRANDRKTRRYAERLQSQLEPNSIVSNFNLNEMITLLNLLRQLKTQINSAKVEEKNKAVAEENLAQVIMLEAKMISIVEPKLIAKGVDVNGLFV
jgi:hypothetical protein